MSTPHHTPACPSLPAIWALEERIRREASHRFRVLDVMKYPRPSLKVKDTVYGIVLAFSSEADYVTYCRVTTEKGA
jgi:hypothetical protein